jgi:hypothetical protein
VIRAKAVIISKAAPLRDTAQRRDVRLC